MLLSKYQNKWEILSHFVAFSENLNFIVSNFYYQKKLYNITRENVTASEFKGDINKSFRPNSSTPMGIFITILKFFSCLIMPKSDWIVLHPVL